MNSLFKLFDSLTEKIPLSVILYIRMAAIFLWFLAAIVAVYFSWSMGSTSAPASGQDIYLSEIKDKATKESNLKNPPELTVPELSDLKPRDKRADLPEFQDVVPERKNGNDLPPYISEKQTPDDSGAYLPMRDEGSDLRRNNKTGSLPENPAALPDNKKGLLPP